MHKASATPLTMLKERLAKHAKSSAHLCYGKRCAQHMAIIDWMVAR
jgi:hypothetical protein